MCKCKQGKKENEFKTQEAVMRVSTSRMKGNRMRSSSHNIKIRMSQK